jgi:hypothetical protein
VTLRTEPFPAARYTPGILRGQQEVTVIYLQILRAVSFIAFFAASYWLAMYHHHDSTLLQNVAIMLPLPIFALSNWLIMTARK